MAVTIKDVAKLAGVAPSTVSRVIANSPKISEKTKMVVRESMEQLGYHPNFNARSLANCSSQALGLIMPSSANEAFQNPFFPEVIRGISTIAHKKEYAILMSTGQTEKEIFEGVKRMVQGGRVDGIFLLYSREDDLIQKYLHDLDFPFTVIGKPYRNVDSTIHVDNDNFGAAKSVTECLIQLGHKRIGFIGGDINLVVTKERQAGYQEALQNANLEIKEQYIVHEEFLKEGGKEAVSGLMSLDERPDALVVVDDLMAVGVLNMLNEMKIKVPDEISVISFNNSMLAEFSHPPLTSVDINIFELGYQAAKHLIEKINNPQEPAKRIIVPYKIIERSSCKLKKVSI